MKTWRHWNRRYEVSSCGRVRNSKTKKLIRQETNHGGYRRVRLVCDDGKCRWKRVHILVLEAFIGPRPSSRHVGAHSPNNDKRNNRIENLRWATPEENEADKKISNTVTGGRTFSLKPPVLEDICLRIQSGDSFTKIAKIHGIHRSTVPRAYKRWRKTG